MYKIIYMKADYEPWWQFEGWEDTIEATYLYESEEDYEIGLQKVITQFREKYEHEKIKKGKYIAFWTETECEYCEACEDDAQLFHGLILEKTLI